ncbi:hypothetical protein [Pseudonocardia acaciae]|uniref:hypothetical protein n=1 Tax=Pseudonocardia acaciae TaxID=551276 RepID=UPI00055DBACB|nr:hypothetical protein [Pseudonocardia acaciae]
MSTTRMPLVLGVVVTALLAGGWLLLAGPGHRADDPASATEGVALSPADRDALAAAPVDAGTAPTDPDPAVDFTDPTEVARAYVVAGYSLTGADAGHTNRRATPYAAPNTPPHTVGVLVVTPPAPGETSTATVTGLTQLAGEPTDTRRGYRVDYLTTQAGAQSRYLVLARQFDGRWLVAGDTPDAQFGEP